MEEPRRPPSRLSSAGDGNPLDKNVMQLSNDCLQEIGSQMPAPHQGKDWKTLGSHLGYSCTDLTRFETDANPGYKMLTDWGTRRASTIRVLRVHLIGMKRDDVVAILDEGMKEPCCLVVVLRDSAGQQSREFVVSTYGRTSLGEAVGPQLRKEGFDPEDITLDWESLASDWMQLPARQFIGQQVTLNVEDEECRRTWPMQNIRRSKDCHRDQAMSDPTPGRDRSKREAMTPTLVHDWNEKVKEVVSTVDRLTLQQSVNEDPEEMRSKEPIQETTCLDDPPAPHDIHDVYLTIPFPTIRDTEDPDE